MFVARMSAVVLFVAVTLIVSFAYQSLPVMTQSPVMLITAAAGADRAAAVAKPRSPVINPRTSVRVFIEGPPMTAPRSPSGAVNDYPRPPYFKPTAQTRE